MVCDRMKYPRVQLRQNPKFKMRVLGQIVNLNRRALPSLALLMLVIVLICLCLHMNVRYQSYYQVSDPVDLNASLAKFDLALQAIAKGQTLSNDIKDALTRGQSLQLLLGCRHRELQFEKVQHGSYWLLRNVVRGTISRRMGCAESITYTTHGDFRFIYNLVFLVARWLAPISVAFYAPGHDFNSTLESILYVRNCLDGSDLIRKFVSFHIYFDVEHMPAYVPLDEQDALRWKYDCETLMPPFEHAFTTMYMVQKKLIYPINVGRNIARQAANTYFILAGDIELFPSVGLVPQFLDLMVRNFSAIIGDDKQHTRRVFAMPVFEITHFEDMPKNKSELVALLRRNVTKLFRLRICKKCHMLPSKQHWINATLKNNKMDILAMTKREYTFKIREPFYISDNREPLFDERVTWEARQSKRVQGLAMCLLGYEYHVLHPAFLMHFPRIGNLVRNEVLPNSGTNIDDLMIKILHEYRKVYGLNHLCYV